MQVGAAGPLESDGPGPGRWALRERLAHQLEEEQDRWFLWLPVAFAAGIAVYFALPDEPWTMAAILPAAVALAVRRALGTTGIAGLLTAALLAAALGFGLAKMRTEVTRAPVLEAQTGALEVHGFVELVEPRPTQGQRVTIRVTALEKHAPDTVPARVRVRTRAETEGLQPGDAVRLKARLNPPPGPSLPGDFDFARAAWFQGLGAVGFSPARAERLSEAGPPPLGLRAWAAIGRVRQAIGERVTAALPGQTGAVANALITGERGGISESTNQVFRDSGLFHILSISGLHMVIMAGAVFVAIRVALAAVPAIALRYPIKKWAAAGAMLGAFGYLLISGAAFATVRSYIMISIMFLAVLLDRPAIALRNVALAALLILVIWPESLLDPGFQMSFAAVVALVATYEWVGTRLEADGVLVRRGAVGQVALFLSGIVVSTLVASLAVAPFGIYHFHNTQLYAVLANLLAIPICNLVVMPAGLAALVALPAGLEAAPLWVMGKGIEAITWCAALVAALPGAVGRVPAIPVQAFVLVVAGGLWWAVWRRPWRLLGVVPIALGVALAPTGRRPDVLIGRNAALVAVRDADGRLSALADRGGNFELTRWLEHDGDGRPPAEAARGTAFRCDGQGCTAEVRGLTVAIANTPASLRDDCARAAILVLRFAKPRTCAGPRAVIDPQDVAAMGAHALYIDADGVRVARLAEERGARPWAARGPEEPGDGPAVAERAR